MTDEDREYYRGRYAYAVRKAELSNDPSTKAAHLLMATEYRQRAGLDAIDADDAPEQPIAADAVPAAQ